MARRDRVPRHKSHTRKRNKNAKLSPFQLEQKRAKLANQVPTVRTIGGLDSIPHSQRHISNYLQEKLKKQKEKRAALELERQQRRDDAAAGASGNSNGSNSSTVDISMTSTDAKKKEAGSPSATTAATATATSSSLLPVQKKKTKTQIVYPSLNEELMTSVGAALRPISRHAKEDDDAAASAQTDSPRSLEEIIARKKERKHKRKQEARRARVAAELEKMEAELQDYVTKANSAGKKKKNGHGKDGEPVSERDRVTAAFERQLRKMEKDSIRQEEEDDDEDGTTRGRKRRRATAADEENERADGNASDNDVTARNNNNNSSHESHAEEEEEPPRQRKRISFNPDVPDPTAAQAARRAARQKKPQDFYELVDVVRYGERVEAPPVFDVVPNHHAAVSRLASQLERKAQGRRPLREDRSGNGNHNASFGLRGADERHRLLSGAGQLGEQKRLARLGLAPAITHTVRADASAAATRMSKEEEIKALRDRVMATYQRNRRKEVAERKGVDMRHEFPKFA